MNLPTELTAGLILAANALRRELGRALEADDLSEQDARELLKMISNCRLFVDHHEDPDDHEALHPDFARSQPGRMPSVERARDRQTPGADTGGPDDRILRQFFGG